jgi:hypothetical protein
MLGRRNRAQNQPLKNPYREKLGKLFEKFEHVEIGNIIDGVLLCAGLQPKC